MDPARHEPLEQFLTASGVTWEALPRDRHARLCAEWDALYVNCLTYEQHIRNRSGARAQEEYLRQHAPEFRIVPFLGEKGGPHAISKRGPRKAAYACRGDGRLPDLSAFALIDFFVAPPDLAWTMIDTHEDYAYGGPYFIRKEWLVPPTRRRAW